MLPLQEDEIYMCELFTNPSYRRKGVRYQAPQLHRKQYSSRGFRTIVGFAPPARKPFGAARRYHVAVIRTLRLGPLRRFWVKTYGPQAEYWRERLKELRWA